MSIEYTIDIQLTELGFPDILQQRDTSARDQTPCRSTSPADSPSPSPPKAPTSAKQRRQVRGQQSPDGADTKQPTEVSASPLSEKLTCKPRSPVRSLQAAKDPAPPDLPEATVTEEKDTPLIINEQEQEEVKEADGRDGETLEEMEEDSDDSDVSGVYEEEEVEEEEDDEDEEGVNNESAHPGDYRCTVCDLHLPSKFKLKDHMNLHTGSRPYCCAECGKRFCQIDSYRVHLRTHAQVKVDRLVCRVCRTAFASPAHLKDHLSRTHFEKEFYECDLCKRVFTSLDQCKYHVQLHKCMAKVVCDKCGRKFSSPKYLTRHRMTFHRNFKCNDCLQTFTKKNALLKHSFSHLGLLPYTCVRCNCHFRLARLYLQHKCEPERIHCVACLREFLSQEDFQQHKKDTGCWGNQEPKGDQIRCLECGQRFETPEELKQHAGAHQRVLKCAECGKGFRSALLLMSHMGGHAGNTPCLCQSCGLGFPHQQNYNSHLKTCGQTPVSASKKSQASRSSSFESKSVNKRPDSANATSTVPVPPAVSDSSAAPVKDGVSPGPEPGDVAAGSASSDGLWKLTLNKQPPPGVKLVLFLPVCQTQPSELTVSDPALQNQPHVALPFGSDEHLGVNTALSSSFNAPLNLSTGIKCDPEWDAPLDLSKKSNLSKSVPVKTEPEEVEISENGDSGEFDHKNPRLTATCTEVKR